MNGSYLNNKSVYFVANFSDNVALKNATLYVWNSTGDVVNNTENRTITGITNSTNISVVLPYDGLFKWNYYACDNNHNCGFNNTINYSLTIDTLAPSVNITYPINNTWYNFNTVNVNYTRNDTNLAYCWYSNDSYTLNTTLTGCANITSVVWSEGQHNVTVWVNDTAGNTNNSQVMFYVDTTYPQINFTSPTPANGTITTNTSITINVSVSEKNLNSLIYNWNSTNYTIYNNSLVFMMNFDNISALGENSTYAVDVSKYGNNGIISNANWNSSGKYGGAYTFDGVNSYLDVGNPSSLNIPNTITVSAWVNTPQPTKNFQMIVTKGNGNAFELRFDGTTGKPMFTPYIGSTWVDQTKYSTSISCNPSLWCFVVGIYDGSSVLTYVNGNLSGSYVISGSIGTTASNLLIGKRSDGYQFNGNIDEVRIWNRSLSAAEVYQQYISNLNKFNSTDWYLYVNQSKNSTNRLADGAYTYFASAKDVSGNENTTETRNVTIDTTLPVINLTYPLNTTYSINVSALNYTIVETNKDSCWWSNSSGVWNSTKVAAGVNWTNLASVEGSNTWTVYCNDSSNNLNSSSVTFYKDTAYPVVNITYPINNTWYNFNTVTVNYTRSDVNLGSCWYSNDSYTLNTTLANCINITTVVWSEGQHNVTVWVNDTAGNTNNSQVMFYVDTTYPQINFTSPTPANGTITTNTSITINVSVSEKNLNSLIYNWNSTNYTIYNDSLVFMMNFDNISALGENSTYAVDVSKYGNNGIVSNANWNSSGKYGGAYSFDGVNSSINVSDNAALNITGSISISAWIKADTWAAASWAGTIVGKDEWSGTGSYSKGYVLRTGGNGALSFVVSTAGTINWREALTSAQMSAGTWYYVTGTFDGTTVTAYINGVQQAKYSGTYGLMGASSYPLQIGKCPYGTEYNSRRFNGNIDEVRIWNRSLSAAEVYQQYISNLNKFNSTDWYLYVNQSKNSTNGLTDGTYTYFASAKDTSGNENTTETRYVSIDTAYPQFSLYWDNNATLISSGTGLFNVTVLNTNGTVLFEINNTNITATNLSANVYNVSYNFATNATYSYKWISWSNGASHLYNISNTRSYTVNNTDVIYPVFSLYLDNNGTLVNSGIAWFNVSVNNTNGTVFLFVNNTNYTARNLTSNIYNVSVSFNANGTYSYYWISWGNGTSHNFNISNTQSYTVLSDTTPPSITIISPQNKTYAVSRIDFNASTNENATCWFSINNWIKNYTMTSNSSKTGFNYTNSSIRDGSYSVGFACNDSYGNENSSSTSFKIDTVNPVVSIIYPVNNSYLNYNVSVSLNYSIETNNTDSCWYSVDNNPNITINNCLNVSLNLSEANHLINLWVNSTAGLVGTNSTNFTIELTHPVINLIAPADGIGYTSNSQSVEFDYNVTDNSQIKNCSLIVNNAVLAYDTNISNLSITHNFIQNFVPGTYSWRINCTNIIENTGNSSVRNFVVTATSGGGTTPSGGGGGGETAQPKANILVDVTDLEIPIVVNTVKTRIITVTNPGEKPINVKVTVQDENGIFTTSDNSFELGAGERKDIEVKFVAPAAAGIYTGKILINEKEVLVSVNVNTKELLFDVGIVIPDNLKTIKVGDRLSSQVTLIPMGEQPRLDVTLNYAVKDFSGKTFLTESETILVEGQKTFKKEFATQDLPEGDYVLGLELVYANGVATSTSHFKIMKKEATLLNSSLYIILALVGVGIVILIALTIVMIRRYKNIRKLKIKRFKK